MSANDAAEALAEANGGIQDTLHAMNAEARVLQAYDTHAETPSGLDGPGETTSAYDLALIAQAGLQDPGVPALHRLRSAPRSRRRTTSTSRSTPTTTCSRPTAATSAARTATPSPRRRRTSAPRRRHGQTIVVTLMHAYPDLWPMARALLNWGFKANGKVAPVGTLVAPIPPAAPVTPQVSTRCSDNRSRCLAQRADTAPLIETARGDADRVRRRHDRDSSHRPATRFEAG